MKNKLGRIQLVTLMVGISILCISYKPSAEWKILFNGKNFSGWDTYIAAAYDTTLKKRDGEPLGLNNDVIKVFSVVKEDEQSALRISGESFGGISTTEEFENYHLQLEFKWGKLR